MRTKNVRQRIGIHSRSVIRWTRTRNFKRNVCGVETTFATSCVASSDHPRLCIHRSLKHFSCQVVDDLSGKTLASASTRDKSVRGDVASWR